MKPEIPTSTDPSPATPPRDWFHYNAKQAEALDRLSRRLAAIEQHLGITGSEPVERPQEATQPAQDAAAAERYVAPAGVVSPHVALNLRALREWIDVAIVGGDVPRP